METGLTLADRSERVGRNNPTDFEISNSSQERDGIVLAAEQRDDLRRAIFFDDPYGDETISAHVRLCTTECV